MFRCNHVLCTICFSAGIVFAVSALIPSAWVRLALGLCCVAAGFLFRRP